MMPDEVRSLIALATVVCIVVMLVRALWSRTGGLRYFYGFVLLAVFGATLFLPFGQDVRYGILRFWFCYLALGYAAIGKANFGVGPVDLLVEFVTLAHTYISIRLSEVIAHRGILLLLNFMKSDSDTD